MVSTAVEAFAFAVLLVGQSQLQLVRPFEVRLFGKALCKVVRSGFQFSDDTFEIGHTRNSGLESVATAESLMSVTAPGG